MLEELKKRAMEQAMRLMSHPAVGKVLSDPRLMGAVAKGFELHGELRRRVEGSLRSLAQGLSLVSREEFQKLSHRLEELHGQFDRLQQKLKGAKRGRQAVQEKTASE